MLKEKQVLCTNCGFLCWQYYNPDDGSFLKLTECVPFWRERIQTSKDMGETVDPETGMGIDIACMRRQWFFAPHIQSNRADAIDIDTLIQPRRCSFYIKYQPAFSPEEHKELIRDAETRKTVFQAALIGAGIGALAAIIAQTLYVFFVS